MRYAWSIFHIQYDDSNIVRMFMSMFKMAFAGWRKREREMKRKFHTNAVGYYMLHMFIV